MTLLTTLRTLAANIVTFAMGKTETHRACAISRVDAVRIANMGAYS